MNYLLKHKRQTLADFNKDCHRFSFWYNGKSYEASCYGSATVIFSDENIPENVKCDIQEEIYSAIDKNEQKWAVPDGAVEIIDAYCAENFC